MLCSLLPICSLNHSVLLCKYTFFIMITLFCLYITLSCHMHRVPNFEYLQLDTIFIVQ